MTELQNIAAIEAILFLHGEPLSAEKISSFLHISVDDVVLACGELSKKYSLDNCGLLCIEKKGDYQIVTKPEFSKFLEEFVKENLKEDLTQATLETLSLIAYFGPITRAHIDFVRGVNSSFTLRNLLIRGLVERKIAKGNMYEYEITFDFLKQLGVSRSSELPRFEEYSKMKDKLFSNKDTDSSVINQT